MKRAITMAAAFAAASMVPSVAQAATSIEFGSNSTWEWKFGGGSYAPIQNVNPASLLTNGTYGPVLPGTSWISSGERDAATGLYSFKGVLTLASLGGDLQKVLLAWRSDNFIRSILINSQTVYDYTGPARNEFGATNPFQAAFSTTNGDLFFTGANEFIVNVQNNAGSGADPVALNISFLGSAVPEPGTWMLMILGFGAVGFTMRRRQQSSVRLQFA